MKPSREFMEMYKWVLLVVAFFIGWAVIAVFGTVFMVVFYPLYGAILLGGFTMIKYQNQEIHDMSIEILKKEILFRSLMFCVVVVLLIIFRNQKVITFEIIIALVLSLCLVPVDVYMKWKQLKKISV